MTAPFAPPRILRPPTTLLRAATSGPGQAVLALGPLVSILAVPLIGWDAAMTESARWVLLALWTPLIPVGVPALALQDFRDQVAPGSSPLTRIGALTWALAVQGPPGVLAATWANLGGLALALAWCTR